MKHVFFTLAVLLSVIAGNAQPYLSLNNNTGCTDMYVVLRATNGGCSTVDQTNIITVYAGTPIKIDFSTGIYTPTIILGSVPSPLWVNGSGLIPGFDFFETDFWDICDTWPVSGSCTYPADGGTLNICVSNASMDFEMIGPSCSGNTCTVCSPQCVPIPCPPKVVHVDFQKIGSDWELTFN